MNAPPAVWKWYSAYCVLVALFNAGMVPFGIRIARGHDQARIPQSDDPEVAEAIARAIPMLGWSMVATGVAFAALNIVILFLPKKPWTYSAHLVNIILGVLSCVFIPLCVPLLLAWLKPETKRFFGVGR